MADTRGLRRSFRTCGFIGFAIAVATSIVLTLLRAQPIACTLWIALLGAVSFYVLALATKVASGEERLVFFRHYAAVVMIALVVARCGEWRIAPALDIVAIGLALMLAVGRVGCWRVGCCHGRPRATGVVYGDDHARHGFPRYYVGSPLFPVQVIDGMVSAGFAAAAIVAYVAGARPGSSFVIFTAGYAAARWGLELLRGDAERPFALGLSEAQWTATLLLTALAALGWSGVLPGAEWCTGLFGASWLASLAVWWLRARRKRRGDVVLLPPDVRLLSEALSLLDRLQADGEVHLLQMPAGFTLSASTPVRGRANHYAFSATRGVMGEAGAMRLAQTVQTLRHRSCRCELLVGARGTHHLVVHHAAVETPRG